MPSIDHIVIPFIQGIGESIKKICSKYGMQTHFKGKKTLKQLLVKSRDQDPIDKKVEPCTCTSVGNLCANEKMETTSIRPLALYERARVLILLFFKL